MRGVLFENPVPPIPEAVEAVFHSFSAEERVLAEGMRARIFDVARETAGVGPLLETLKWGTPAYLTEETGAGTTLRIARAKGGGVGLYVHCQSRVVAQVRLVHDKGVVWDGTRGLIISPGETVPVAALRAMILTALTFRL